MYIYTHIDYDKALNDVLPTVAPLVKAAVCTLYT